MIVALGDATEEQAEIRSTPDDFQRYGFDKKRLFETFLAERDATPVGLCLFFYSFSTWLGEPGIYVQDLYVADTERGNGLGRRLLAMTAAYGRKRDASHLRLSVNASNHSAKQFYKHLGMDHRHQEDTFHLGGDPFLALASEQP